LLGFDIKDLFYQEINGGLQVELNTSDSINLTVDVALGLDGDRYNKDFDYAGTDADKESLANKVNVSEIYYVFKQDADGNYIKGENGNYVRAITSKEENEVAAKDRYAKYKVKTDEGIKEPYLVKVLDNGKGDGSELLDTTQKLSMLADDESAVAIYKYVSGAAANKSYVSDGGKYAMLITCGDKYENNSNATSKLYVLLKARD